MPPDQRLGTAMRRVVVTPTFAAGLGVVVAAVLAYPMHTVFSYAEPPSGATCKVLDCGLPTHGSGDPAAGTSNRLKPKPQHAPHTVTKGSGPAAGRTSPAGGAGHAVVTASPDLRYRPAGQAQGGFSGAITIMFRPGAAPAHWRLRFGYPAARIVKVWAGRYLRHGAHTATVTSRDLAGQASANRPVAVWIGVTGHPAPPRVCSFDGQPCHIAAHAGQDGGGTGR
jgi:hypothetical protein